MLRLSVLRLMRLRIILLAVVMMCMSFHTVLAGAHAVGLSRALQHALFCRGFVLTIVAPLLFISSLSMVTIGSCSNHRKVELHAKACTQDQQLCVAPASQNLLQTCSWAGQGRAGRLKAEAQLAKHCCQATSQL